MSIIERIKQLTCFDTCYIMKKTIGEGYVSNNPLSSYEGFKINIAKYSLELGVGLSKYLS